MFEQSVVGIRHNHRYGKGGDSARKLTIRCTVDPEGKTLTIADENNGISFEVPVEMVEYVISEERKKAWKRADIPTTD